MDASSPSPKPSAAIVRPVRYDEEVLVRTQLLNVRESVIHFGYELLRADGWRAAGGRRDHAHRY